MKSQPWLWFVVAAAVIIVVVIVVQRLGRKSGERRSEGEQFGPRIPSTHRAAVPPAGIQGEVPYGIAARPMPEGEDVDRLLPRQVGPYVRESVKPPRGIEQSTYADYRRGDASIFVELYISDDASGAQIGVSNAKRETDAEFGDGAERSVYSFGGDVGYFKYAGLMAWTRGRYFFLANAKGGEKDLDEFMKAFPY